MSSDNFTITDAQRDYSQFGLKRNPFPYSPVPTDNPEIYCGQEHATAAVSETVSAMLSTGKSKHLVITGKYGNGKSHTLKYTRSLVRDREDVIAGYVAQPGEGFIDIYHEFMYDLGFQDIQQTAYEYLAFVARDVTDRNPSTASAMEQLITEGEILLSEFVSEAIQRLSDITKFADFARALVHMIYEDTNLYAWQWLTAEGIRYEQRKEMEIHTALDDDTMGVRAFTAFKNVLLELGYTGVFVFVDEFEGVARLNSKHKQTTLNSIRHLMDQNSRGLCILFGCAPEVWQEVMAEYHAFSERISGEVPLRPLTEEHISELVSQYLDTASSRRSNSISPFTDDGITMILQRSQGNIRQVLSICSQTIDQAIDEERHEIDAAFVEESLTS